MDNDNHTDEQAELLKTKAIAETIPADLHDRDCVIRALKAVGIEVDDRKPMLKDVFGYRGLLKRIAKHWLRRG